MSKHYPLTVFLESPTGRGAPDDRLGARQAVPAALHGAPPGTAEPPGGRVGAQGGGAIRLRVRQFVRGKKQPTNK